MNTTKISQPNHSFDFHLPDQLQCGQPTELRGIARDEVKLMVSNLQNDQIEHTQFKAIDQYLKEGDVLVVNTSGTLKAALNGQRKDRTAFRIHLSTKLNEQDWIVELRQVEGQGNKRFHGAQARECLYLQNGGLVRLLENYYPPQSNRKHLQLWKARLEIDGTVEQYLENFGEPIRYSYAKKGYPVHYYQTLFANEMGSAEMPSAGRAFTPELVSRLIRKGIQFAPILLHTGVASLELDEKPYEEYFRVSDFTAKRLNLARMNNRRIIAVGTTVVRALESVTDRFSFTQHGEGWTNLHISPKRGVFAIDGLITGFHEPRASHLLMLEALAGRQHLQLTYDAAIKASYQWHEFGDLHLLL